MTRDALGRHFPHRAMTRDAICLDRHEDVRSVVALSGVMAIVALHAQMFEVIETRLRHPAIHQYWFGDRRRGFRNRLYFMTKSASGKTGSCPRSHLALRFVGIGREKNCLLQFVAAPKSFAQTFDLLTDK